MPRKTTKKKTINKKVKKTSPRRAVPLAIKDTRLHASPGSGNGSMARQNGSVAKRTDLPVPSADSPFSDREGAHFYDVMYRWSPLPIILRQQALAASMFLSLTQIWNPK